MGINKDVKIQKTPLEVEFKERVVKIASGNDHVVALSDRGEIFTFGAETRVL